MRLGIVAQKENDRASDLAIDLARHLAGSATVRVDANTAAVADAPVEGIPVAEMAGDDLVVSVGGDGTFLYVARQVETTPILGVNLGEVGFLNAVPPEEATESVRAEIAHVEETGSPRYREVPRIRARWGESSIAPALNEVVVQGPGRGHGQGVDIGVRVDGAAYLNDRADGVVIATQTGSTAYNLSEGGPIAHPSMSGMVVTPMCPRDPVPSLVLGPDRTVVVRITDAGDVTVVGDGSERERLEAPAEIEVDLGSPPARIAGPRSEFFRALEKID
jgi:NAD+ kinase